MALDLRSIEQAAQEQGYTVGRTKKNHPKFTPPDPTKEIVIFSGTPSDVRAIKNGLARLRRQGFVWPPPRS
jgi:hypothetical protein